MWPLKNEPASRKRVLYLFYDFENTPDTGINDKTSVHVPNLACLKKFCSKCKRIPHIEQNYLQFGKRKHTFWEDPVGDKLSYLFI